MKLKDSKKNKSIKKKLKQKNNNQQKE